MTQPTKRGPIVEIRATERSPDGFCVETRTSRGGEELPPMFQTWQALSAWWDILPGSTLQIERFSADEIHSAQTGKEEA